MQGDGMRASDTSDRKSGAEPSRRPKIAYLGPRGTYGHQAAKRFAKHLGGSIADGEMIPCATIPEIYTNPAEYLVMPFQNVIQGGVTETLDSLLSSIAGPSKERDVPMPRIIADLDLPIRHSLVARRGVRMEDVQWVRSHEQALGQCSAFLDQHLPRAKRIPWASTAGAAMSLLGEDEAAGIGAAICSASAVLDHPELEVLYDGTQGISDNFTRFLLLTRLDPPSTGPSPPHRAQSPRSHFYALTNASSLAHFTSIRAVHTRPHPAQSSPQERYPHLLLVETSEAVGQDPTSAEEVLYLGSAIHIPDEP